MRPFGGNSVFANLVTFVNRHKVQGVCHKSNVHFRVTNVDGSQSSPIETHRGISFAEVTAVVLASKTMKGKYHGKTN